MQDYVWRNAYGCCSEGRSLPWISIKCSDGSLLHVRQCGHIAKLSGPAGRYVSDAIPVEELSLLREKLGSVPDLWPDNTRKIRKLSVKNSGAT